MSGKVLSVLVPRVDDIDDLVRLFIIPLNQSGELAVDKAGATHGARLPCCPGHELDGWTPTDTRATDARSSQQQKPLLMARIIQLIKREVARPTDVLQQQLLASSIHLIKR